MFHPPHPRPYIGLGLLICLLSALAASAALKVGDTAPKLKAAKWLRGDPVTAFEGDKVYIVEFWATWCGPCVASIPHLNEIYVRHKDKGLVVIGQNVMEDDDQAVAAFVKGMAGKMTYRVTLDDQGHMAKHWLQAAGQNGIPCAFIVNKRGKIAYIGHPMSIEESLLDKLLAEPSTQPAAAAAPPPSAELPPAARDLAARAAEALQAGRTGDAEGLIARLHDELPDAHRHLAALLELDLLLARKQHDDAVQLARILCEDFAARPDVLASVATHLAAPADAAPALLDTAEKIATPLAASADPAVAAEAAASMARIATLRNAAKPQP